MNVLEVRVTAEGGDEVEVYGTTIGPEPRLFLASAYGFGIMTMRVCCATRLEKAETTLM